jgi:hypothetical protein
VSNATIERTETMSENQASSPARAASKNRASGANVIAAIFKREFAGYLNTPVAYILMTGTLLVLGVYFFFYNSGGFWQIDRASMTRLLVFVPAFLCVFTAPLFTMRTLSEEKRLGTLELLITMPVKDSEVILGKYFAALAMVAVQLLLLLAYPIVLFGIHIGSSTIGFNLGDFDWGSRTRHRHEESLLPSSLRPFNKFTQARECRLGRPSAPQSLRRFRFVRAVSTLAQDPRGAASQTRARPPAGGAAPVQVCS